MGARTAALKDPDERLGVILDAIVEAFEGDPAEPLLILGTGSGSVVRHPCWGIEPDVVRKHDLSQLDLLGFIAWESDTAFFPTPNGRMASASPALFLTKTAEGVADEEESSRLRSTAEKLRAGDIAVGAAGSFTGSVIRALLGIG